MWTQTRFQNNRQKPSLDPDQGKLAIVKSTIPAALTAGNYKNPKSNRERGQLTFHVMIWTNQPVLWLQNVTLVNYTTVILLTERRILAAAFYSAHPCKCPFHKSYGEGAFTLEAKRLRKPSQTRVFWSNLFANKLLARSQSLNIPQFKSILSHRSPVGAFHQSLILCTIYWPHPLATDGDGENIIHDALNSWRKVH